MVEVSFELSAKLLSFIVTQCMTIRSELSFIACLSPAQQRMHAKGSATIPQAHACVVSCVQDELSFKILANDEDAQHD